MDVTRRDFIGTVSAAAAVPGLRARSLAGAISDPLGVRADFPVVERMIYLDSAYITPSPVPSVESAQRFLQAKASNPVSLGAMLAETDAVRGKFADLIGAGAEEVGVLYATSDGENIVARALELGRGDNVVVDDLHYETTYLLYQRLAERTGLEVRVVKSHEGATSAATFSPYVDARTRLVSVAWVSHQNGFCHDLAALAELAHANGAYLYADAIQGVGMLDIDVRGVDIDFLTTGTYKWLLGGYGVAPFYVKAELLDLVAVDRFGSLHISEDLGDHRFAIHDDARKYGYATMSFGAVFQLSAALDYLGRVGVRRIEGHTVPLAHRLRDGLVDQGFDVWTPAGNRSAIVTFEHGGDIERVRHSLEEARVKVSFKENGAKLRVGVALFNNQEDVDRLLEVTESWG